jgi:hypothetical protein
MKNVPIKQLKLHKFPLLRIDHSPSVSQAIARARSEGERYSMGAYHSLINSMTSSAIHPFRCCAWRCRGTGGLS